MGYMSQPLSRQKINECAIRQNARATETYFVHLAPSYFADTIRAYFPTLGIAGNTTVISISRRSK